MSEDSRAGVRKKVFLPTHDFVEVRFHPRGKVAGFVCVACADLFADSPPPWLVWNQDKQWFSCPNCGFELLPDEADLLLEDALTALLVIKRTDGVFTERSLWESVRAWLIRVFRRRSEKPLLRG
jgi:hypothetical protein